MATGESIAQLLVEIGADVGGLLDGLSTAKSAVEQFASAGAAAASDQDVFGQRVSDRLRLLARDYQALGASEQDAAASAESARGAIEASVAAAAQRRVASLGGTSPTAVIEPLDQTVGARISQVAAQFRLLGQSEEEAAASAAALRGQIEGVVSEQAKAKIERLAPALKDTGTAANPLTRIFGGLGDEVGSVGKMMLGMAGGMLAANAALSATQRVTEAAEAFETLGTSTMRIQRLTGETAEDASLLLGTLTRYGTDADQASKALVRFDQALHGLEDPLDVAAAGGKSGAQVLRELGVAATDAAGQLRSPTDVLLDLADQLQGRAADDQVSIVSRVFKTRGNEAEGLLRVLQQGRAGIQAYMDELKATGNTLSGDQVQDVVAFSEAHRQLSLALGGVAIQLGGAFAPALTSAAQLIKDAALATNQVLVPAIKAVPEALGWVIDRLGDFKLAVGLVATVITVEAVPAMFNWAKVTVQSMGSAAIASGRALIAMMAPFGPLLAVIATAIAVGVALKLAWESDFLGIREIVGGVVNFVGDKIAGLMDFLADHNLLGVQKDWRASWDTMKTDAGNAVGAVGNNVKNALDGLLPDFKMAGLDAGKQYGEAATSGVVAAAQAASDAAKAKLQGVQDQQSQRQFDFDSSHVDLETDVLQKKLAQTEAQQQLVDYQQQLEDLDRTAIDYAAKRLDLDQQDAITRAKITEDALKANDEDLSYQEKLLKAQVVASRHGGAPVDTQAVHQQLRQLHNQQLQQTPALLIAEHNTSLAERAKEGTDLQGQLKSDDVARVKLQIEEAMQPLQDAATAAKRIAEDTQHTLDLAKQRFAIDEKAYALELLRAQIDAKKADHDLYAAQHPEAGSVTVNVGGVTVTAASGDAQLDHMKVLDAVYAGVTKAVQDAKSPPVVVSAQVGGARYAAA